MINVYESILSDPGYFKQLAVKDNLLVNYQCPQMEDWVDLYSHFNHIIYTTGGKKLLVSPAKSCLLTEGKLVFLKKGAIRHGKFFNTDRRTIVFCISDSYLHQLFKECRSQFSLPVSHADAQEAVIEISTNNATHAYFYSLLPYFTQTPPPSERCLLMAVMYTPLRKAILICIGLSAGGGGNFGVVVSFLFRAHPVSLVYGGPMLWETEDAKEIMQWYREFIKEAPDDLNGFFVFITVPPFPQKYHHKKMCGIVWCYTGNMADAENVFLAIREFKKPAVDFTGPIPFPALQGLFDPLMPPGMQWYWKADYVNELNNEAIDLHIAHANAAPTWLSAMHLYPINGAAARVGKQESAWYHRDATWAMVIAGVDEHADGKPAVIRWAKEYWTALHPYAAGGAYINFIMDEGEESIKAIYNDNYERLGAIKAIYDPHNLFRVNQNIKPKERVD